MTVPSWVIAAGAGLVAGALACNLYWVDQRRAEHASAQATLDAATTTIASLRASQAHYDTLYITQTKTNTVLRTHWDTVRTLLQKMDTVIYRDTIVRKVVETADSAIQACNALVVTCGERTAILLQRIHADSTILRATTSELSRAKIRNRIGCFAGGVGAVIQGTVKAGFGVGCGIRLW